MTTITTLALAAALSALALDATAQTPPAATTPAPSPTPSPALPTTASVRPGGDILLVPGRQLVVAWKMGAPPTQVSEQAAGPHGLPPIPSHQTDETWGKPIPVEKLKAAEPGQIAFNLWVEEGRGTTLAVTGGQTEPFFYMANMIRRHEGRLLAIPTTICAVRPGAFGLETWPYPVEGVQIVGIGLIPADMCYDHAAKKGYKAGTQPPSSAAKP